MEEREGTITDVAAMKLRDHSTETERNFTNPASVDVIVNDAVVFVHVIAGNGNEINIVKKKKS